MVWFFDDFELDVERSELRKLGELIQLQDKPFQLLTLLLEHAGHPVTREAIRQRLWHPDTFVEFDDSLNHAVRKVRDALGDSAETPRFIKTIPRRGYQFIAPVRAGGPTEPGNAKMLAPADERRGSRARMLRSLAGAVAALLTLAALAVWARLDGPQSPQVSSLMVLPFENLGPDKRDEYFGDGLTEELINRLSSVKGLRVLARTTAFHFKGRNDDVREIARKLEVEAILTGSVRRQGDRLRIIAHLSRGSDGAQVWSQVFDRGSNDLFAVQEEISGALASRLGSGGGPSPVRRVTVSQEAHRLLLLGNFHRSKFERADLEKAIAYYQEATTLDPQFAQPYAEMAYAYAALANALLWPPGEAYPAALEAARKAAAMDDRLAAAHTGLGIYYLAYAWDWAAAERELRRAIALNPCEAQAHHWHAHYFEAVGRRLEALQASERALECDPLALDLNHHLAEHFCAERDFERCIAIEQKTLELDSRYVLALWKLRVAYQALGRYREAIQTMRLAGQAEDAQRLGDAYVKSGKKGFWHESVNMLLEQPDTTLLAPFLAFAYAQLGDKQAALDWLERTYGARSFWMINIRHQWELDPLRAEPRFQELVRRMRFP